MSGLLTVVGLGLVLSLILWVLREQSRPFATLVSLVGGVLLLLLLVDPLIRVVNDVTRLAALATIPGVYLGLILKVIGIAYLTTFAARLAADSGEPGVGLRLELAGKLFILLMAVPLIASVTEALLRMVPS